MVKRSAASRSDYGPDFRYSHFAGLVNPALVIGAVLGFVAALVLVQVPPARRAIGRRIPQGEGGAVASAA